MREPRIAGIFTACADCVHKPDTVIIQNQLGIHYPGAPSPSSARGNFDIEKNREFSGYLLAKFAKYQLPRAELELGLNGVKLIYGTICGIKRQFYHDDTTTTTATTGKQRMTG
jgi:hypothetical protein